MGRRGDLVRALGCEFFEIKFSLGHVHEVGSTFRHRFDVVPVRTSGRIIRVERHGLVQAFQGRCFPAEAGVGQA